MSEDRPEDQGRKCPTCNGKGWIVLLVTRERCPECDGSGRLEGRFDGDDDDLEFDDEHDTPPRGIKV